MRSVIAYPHQRGFTLIEIIVGLAVSSLILLSLNLVMGTINRGFEQTTKSIARQTGLSTALDVISADLARIERMREAGKPKGAFLFRGQKREMIFPLVERPGNNAAGLYLIRMWVRQGDNGQELVRDRAPLPLDAFNLANKDWDDEVVLIQGPFDIQFDYRAQRSGLRSWASSWNADDMMPEQIQLTVTDLATRRLRLPVFVQSLAIEAETACVEPRNEACGKPDAGKAR
jgi:prepilin-type N-terminal cleavage/methylation domain-containing protein